MQAEALRWLYHVTTMMGHDYDGKTANMLKDDTPEVASPSQPARQAW